MNKLDMRIGDPIFMQEYWQLIEKLFDKTIAQSRTSISWGMNYDYAQTWQPLKDQIVKLHKLIGNAETNGYEIVIGNGISQLLSASTYALSKKGVGNICAGAPHWSRFESLARAGVVAATVGTTVYFRFNSISPTKENRPFWSSAEIITIPSNPENFTNEKKSVCTYTIHDLCYYWPQYCSESSHIKRKDDIMLFGLSKATGHAGTRVGWALVKNPQIATDMKAYVVMTTSGVSMDAQKRAKDVIECIGHVRNEEMMNCFEIGQYELTNRWTQLLMATEYNDVGFKVLNHSGLFAWCEWTGPWNGDKLMGAQRLLDRYDVLGIEGEAFGNPRDHAKFRISIGCDKDTFNEFIKRLSSP